MPGAYTKLLYHFVFSTRERRALIDAAAKPRLYAYMRGILEPEQGEVLDVNGVADHVHLFVRLHPTMAVADALRLLKANSSKWTNEAFPDGPRFAWQEGYAAFTVSQSQVSPLVAYIKAQDEHHRKVDFRKELVRLLKRHGIDFEERYLV